MSDSLLSLCWFLPFSVMPDSLLPIGHHIPSHLYDVQLCHTSVMTDPFLPSSMMMLSSSFLVPDLLFPLCNIPSSMMSDSLLPLWWLLPSFLPFSMCDATLPLNSEMSKSIIPLWCQTPSFPIDARFFSFLMVPDLLLPVFETLSFLSVRWSQSPVMSNFSSFFYDATIPPSSMMSDSLLPLWWDSLLHLWFQISFFF